MLTTIKQVPRAIWVTLFAVIGNSFGWSISAYMALFLHLHRGVSVTQVGTVMAGFGIGALIGALISGYITDKYPAHLICFISLIANAMTVLLFPFIHQYMILMGINMLMGISNSAFSPANRVYIMSICPIHLRAQVANIRYTMINIGMGSGIFLCGWLSQINVILPFYFSSAVMFLSASFLISQGEFSACVKDATSLRDTNSNRRKIALLFWLNLCFSFMMQMSFSQLRSTYPLFLYQYYHIGQLLFSHLFLINCFLIAAIQIPLSILLARFNTYIVAGVGSLAIGIGFMLLMFNNQYWWAVLATVIWTLGEMVYFPLSQLLVYDLAPANRKGRAMGLYQFTYAASNIVGPALGSILLAHGYVNWIWILSGVFGVITLVGLVISRSYYPLPGHTLG